MEYQTRNVVAMLFDQVYVRLLLTQEALHVIFKCNVMTIIEMKNQYQYPYTVYSTQYFVVNMLFSTDNKNVTT